MARRGLAEARENATVGSDQSVNKVTQQTQARQIEQREDGAAGQQAQRARHRRAAVILDAVRRDEVGARVRLGIAQIGEQAGVRKLREA